jgi:hypothetical protein
MNAVAGILDEFADLVDSIFAGVEPLRGNSRRKPKPGDSEEHRTQQRSIGRVKWTIYEYILGKRRLAVPALWLHFLWSARMESCPNESRIRISPSAPCTTKSPCKSRAIFLAHETALSLVGKVLAALDAYSLFTAQPPLVPVTTWSRDFRSAEDLSLIIFPTTDKRGTLTVTARLFLRKRPETESLLLATMTLPIYPKPDSGLRRLDQPAEGCL